MAEEAQQSDCILVADGDVLVRHAIADYLRNCGYVVIEAASTNEVVAVLNEPSLPVRAVLCDSDLPGSNNAFELRLWAAEHRNEVHFAIAGNAQSAATKAAELCDEGPQLSRPYDPQSLIDYIRRILGSARSTKVGAAG